MWRSVLALLAALVAVAPPQTGTAPGTFTVRGHSEAPASGEPSVDCAASVCYYIRDGGTASMTGTGACVSTGSGNWHTANACDDFPATMVRGAYYLVADGRYGGEQFNEALSGTSRMVVLKARSFDHGTDTGWDPAYGDGQAVLGGVVRYDASYYTLDGNTDAIGAYGFVIESNAPASGSALNIGRNVSASVDHLVIRGVSINCLGIPDAFGIGLDRADDVLFANFEVWNCNDDPVHFGNGTNITFEYGHIHTRNGGGAHADAWQLLGLTNDNNVIRYCRVDWDGQQIFFGGQASGTHDRWAIYGNRFYGGAASGKALHVKDDMVRVGPIAFYNNTMVGFRSNAPVNFGVATGDGKNNILYDSLDARWGRLTHDYNRYQTGDADQGEAHDVYGGDPFTAAASGDFTLAAALAGAPLSAVYQVSPCGGGTRGSDGTWDRGACEWTASLPSPEDILARFWVVAGR